MAPKKTIDDDTVKPAPAKKASKPAAKKPGSNSDSKTTTAAKKKSAAPAKKGTTGSVTMSEAATAEVTSTVTDQAKKHLIRGKFNPYVPAADEEYMSPAQLEHFKIILNDWKTELMNEVDRTVGHMKDESANLPDPADRATQEEEFSLELRTRDRERKLIKKIDKTLETIENDEYGFCEDCGIEVGLRRLEARPTATLCIDCKTLAEIKEKQYRS